MFSLSAISEKLKSGVSRKEASETNGKKTYSKSEQIKFKRNALEKEAADLKKLHVESPSGVKLSTKIDLVEVIENKTIGKLKKRVKKQMKKKSLVQMQTKVLKNEKLNISYLYDDCTETAGTSQLKRPRISLPSFGDESIAMEVEGNGRETVKVVDSVWHPWMSPGQKSGQSRPVPGKQVMEYLTQNSSSQEVALKYKKDRTDLIASKNNVYQTISIRCGSVLIVALPANGFLHFEGWARVKVVTGRIQVYGYMMERGDTQVVFSPSSHALVGIHVKSLGFDDDILPRELRDRLKKNAMLPSSVAVIEFSRYHFPAAKFLRQVGCKWLLRSKNKKPDKLWQDIVGVNVMTLPEGNSSLLVENTHLNNVKEKIWQDMQSNQVPIVVVCGEKGLGKSATVKFLVNDLLSRGQHLEGVGVLDIDPGQPEMSPACTLSFTIITKPLLGPAFTHDRNQFKFSKQVLLGATSVQFLVEEYLQCVDCLTQVMKTFPEVPVVVNTMGWLHGLGLSITMRMLKCLRPTLLVHLKDESSRFSSQSLSCEDVNGLIEDSISLPLNYQVMVIPTNINNSIKGVGIKSKDLRDLTLLTRLSIMAYERHIFKMDWESVAIHACGSSVSSQHILQVINGSLVALCQAEPNVILKVPCFPSYLRLGGAPPVVLGWAVVRGIDPGNHCLHILTDENERTLADVNILMVPQMQPPASFYEIFCHVSGPYLQPAGRSDSGALTVGRVNKPRIFGVHRYGLDH